MFHPPGSKEGRHDHDQCHNAQPLQKAETEFLSSCFRTIFAFIFIFKNKLFPVKNKKAI